jgi:hypothetical protein
LASIDQWRASLGYPSAISALLIIALMRLCLGISESFTFLHTDRLFASDIDVRLPAGPLTPRNNSFAGGSLHWIKAFSRSRLASPGPKPNSHRQMSNDKKGRTETIC